MTAADTDADGLREALTVALERRFPLSRWQAEAQANGLIAGPLADILARLAALEAENARLRKDTEAWKRLAVIAAVPLEAIRASGSIHWRSADIAEGVNLAVVAIRMAVCGHGLPPAGTYDESTALARTALAQGGEDTDG